MLQTPTSDQSERDTLPVLQVSNLQTEFILEDGIVEAVCGVDLTIKRGETMAVVGESGCGKSMTARSILGLVDRPGRIAGGQVWVPGPPADAPQQGKRRRLFKSKSRETATKLRGSLPPAPDGMVDLVTAEQETIQAVRGKRISMVFQEPMTSLSVVHTIGNQIAEAILLHEPMSKEDARRRAIDLLGRVGIPAPEKRIDNYPFELSGGMRQRVMIAMALSCEPELLIADEPTTALDVTTQAQILELLKSLQQEFGMAIMLITHDLGVAAQMADRVTVMYLGKVVESGEMRELFENPKHPYTRALLRSVPALGMRKGARLDPVRGIVPHPYDRPSGCTFHDRCDYFIEGRCDTADPALINIEDRHQVRCVLFEEDK
jgi:peptide/nickel transport system ATP-binding protein